MSDGIKKFTHEKYSTQRPEIGKHYDIGQRHKDNRFWNIKTTSITILDNECFSGNTFIRVTRSLGWQI